MIIDLQERRRIWADIALSRHPRWDNNVHHNLSGFSMMLRSLKELNRPNLDDLFELHAKALGRLVPSQDQADVVFGRAGQVSPFDLDVIRAEYLSAMRSP